MLVLIEALLSAAGHEVKTHLAGSFGLPAIARSRPDVILSDLVMAEMDGLELCKEIKGRDDLKKTLVIMVSGQGSDHWKERAAEAGAAGYIVKPLDPATFAEEVEEIFAAN